VDTNCDGNIPRNEADTDGDGYMGCNGECDDFDAAIYPGAAEVCDGRDNDCSGQPDADEVDRDGDGVMLCDADCDDEDPDLFPGNTEICDGKDNDCDGNTPADETDADADWMVSPYAAELCGDGIDSNCDGSDDVDCVTCAAVVQAPDSLATAVAITPNATVCAQPGTFSENIVFGAGDSKLVGLGGPHLTTLLGNQQDSVVTIDLGQGPDTLLSGFTIRNGYDDYQGGNVHVEDSSPTLTNLILSGGDSLYVAGGLYLNGSDSFVSRVEISGNDGGGLTSYYGDPNFEDLVIIDNVQADQTGGGVAFGSGTITVTGAFIARNQTTDASYGRGAGMAINGGSVTLTDVEFIGNSAAHYGGALYVSSQTDLVIDGATSAGNHSQDTGGALHLYDISYSLDDVAVLSNTANGEGGGMYNRFGDGQLTDVRFAGNSSDSYGGGATMEGLDSLVMTGFTFEDNQAYSHAGAKLSSSTVAISDGIVARNRTENSGAGGGFYGSSTDGTISGVWFDGNSAGFQGYAHGGGMDCTTCNLAMDNLLFTGNNAMEGGALYLYASSDTLTNVLFADNAAGAFGKGGGIWMGWWDGTLSNVIVAGNGAGSGGGIYMEDSNPVFNGVGLYAGADTFTIRYSDAWGNSPNDWSGITDPTGVDGTLAEDPVFMDISAPDAVDWDLHLDPASLLVDAGDPAAAAPDGGAADMGAYGVGAADLWDLDGDGYPCWWQPGAYDAVNYPGQGWDCDDLDAAVYPGSGC